MAVANRSSSRPTPTTPLSSSRQDSRALWPWVITGLGIRLAVASFTSHPFDMSVWISQQARFYNAGLNPLLDWKFSLPMMGVLLSTFFPALGASRVFGIPQVLAQQFWIKLPFIAADVWIALLLRRSVARATGSERDGRRAGLLWLLNPVAIFYTSVHGQFDALPAALMLLGFLLIQEGRKASAFGAFLLSGTAKYFAFLLVPLLWAWGGADGGRAGTRTVRVGIATVTVASLGFASVAVPGLRESLLGGLVSNVVGSQASLWSVWSPLTSVDRLGLGWVALFFCLYAVVLLNLRMQRPSGPPDPLRFLGAATAVLAVLIALDPFANPQFYIWVMPLLIVLAFARRSFLLFSLTAFLGFLNLLVFWRSESAAIWFLNAVPDVMTLPGFWSAPPGFVDLGAARGMGFVYGLGLISVGLLGLISGVHGGLHRQRTRRWRLGVGGATLAGALCSLGFVVYSFQPSLSANYDAAPAYPADLTRLNSLPAARVWLAPGGEVVEASWSDVHQKLLGGGSIVRPFSSSVPPPLSPRLATHSPARPHRFHRRESMRPSASPLNRAASPSKSSSRMPRTVVTKGRSSRRSYSQQGLDIVGASRSSSTRRPHRLLDGSLSCSTQRNPSAAVGNTSSRSVMHGGRDGSGMGEVPNSPRLRIAE